MEMKFFADTADIEEIAYCFSRGVDDGITTNPKIMEISGDLSRGIRHAYQTLIKKYPNIPISLETDLRGIPVTELESNAKKVKEVLVNQAYELADLGKNVVIKIPICRGGILATEELSKRDIKTNVTVCMTPYQALAAADAGGKYVSLFANRMLDGHILELAGHSLEEILTNPEWKKLVTEAKEEHFEEAWKITLDQIAYVAEKLDNNPYTDLIVGSIRSPEDIHRLIQARPQIITIPSKIVRELEDIFTLKQIQRSISSANLCFGSSISHPTTQYTLDEFEKSADRYRN